MDKNKNKKNTEEIEVYGLYKNLQKVWCYIISGRVNPIFTTIISVFSFLAGGAIYLYGNYASLPARVSAIEDDHIEIKLMVAEIKEELRHNTVIHKNLDVSLQDVNGKVTNIESKLDALYLKLVKN